MTKRENRSSWPTTVLIRGALWAWSACVVLIFSGLRDVARSLPSHHILLLSGILGSPKHAMLLPLIHMLHAIYTTRSQLPLKLTKFELLISFKMIIREFTESFLAKLLWTLSDVGAHIFIFSPQKAEAGGHLWLWGYPGLHRNSWTAWTM